MKHLLSILIAASAWIAPAAAQAQFSTNSSDPIILDADDASTSNGQIRFRFIPMGRRMD